MWPAFLLLSLTLCLLDSSHWPLCDSWGSWTPLCLGAFTHAMAQSLTFFRSLFKCHLNSEAFFTLPSLNSDLFPLTLVPLTQPGASPPSYPFFFSLARAIYFTRLPSVFSHQSGNSMRARAIVCFLHSWFPGFLESPWHIRAQQICFEWMNGGYSPV